MGPVNVLYKDIRMRESFHHLSFIFLAFIISLLVSLGTCWSIPTDIAVGAHSRYSSLIEQLYSVFFFFFFSQRRVVCSFGDI